MAKKITKHQKQSGMVSILVTMILMIVISLIVIGFARLVRREQRQSLDTQLSTQAFYAAETGINDAINAIQTQGYQNEKTNCGPDAAGPLSVTNANNVLDDAVEYTCLLVDPSPSSLEYNSIEIDKATVIPVQAQSGTIDKLILSWQDKTGDSGLNCTNSLGVFPPVASWPADCNAGTLRIDLVPTGGSVSRSSLLNNVLTAFLQPVQSGSGTLAYNLPANNGATIGANCSANATPKICRVTITGLSGSSYYLRVRSIYKSSALNVSAQNAANATVELIGAQAIIDATGKANDVLRRVVVRIPTSELSSGDVPDFAILSSDTICKRMSVAPGLAPVISDPNPACQIN